VHAGKMEPFSGAVVVVAGNHVAIGHFVAVAVSGFVAVFLRFHLGLGFCLGFLVVLFLCDGACSGGRRVRFHVGDGLYSR
jgi:hypothetical protein